MFPSKHSGVAIAIRENTFLPANVRRINTPPAPLAGRGGSLKLVRGDAAFFLIMSLFLPTSTSNLRRENNSARRFGSGRLRFWTKRRRASCQCFCRMTTVTFPKLHGQSRPVSTAARKPHSNGQCLGELFAGPPFAGGEHFLPPWEATFLGTPSPILRSALRVFQLLFMFTDVVHYTTTEGSQRQGKWQHPRARWGEGAEKKHPAKRSQHTVQSTQHRVPTLKSCSVEGKKLSRKQHKTTADSSTHLQNLRHRRQVDQVDTVCTIFSNAVLPHSNARPLSTCLHFSPLARSQANFHIRS